MLTRFLVTDSWWQTKKERSSIPTTTQLVWGWARGMGMGMGRGRDGDGDGHRDEDGVHRDGWTDS